MGLKEKIKSAPDLPWEKVTVPEWDCDVLIVGLTAGGRAWWSEVVERLREKDKREKARLEKEGSSVTITFDFTSEYVIPLLARTLRDPDTREFVFEGEEDAQEVLGDKNQEVVMRLFETALKLSGLGAVAEAEIKENFPESPSNGSSSS